MIRKAAAFGILATFAGLLIEAQVPDGRWQRAPLTGVGMLAALAIVGWAERELSREAAER